MRGLNAYYSLTYIFTVQYFGKVILIFGNEAPLNSSLHLVAMTALLWQYVTFFMFSLGESAFVLQNNGFFERSVYICCHNTARRQRTRVEDCEGK